MSRANKSLKRLQRKRKNSAKALHKQREAYLRGEAPRTNSFGIAIPWKDGVKSLFPSRATGKLACSSLSRQHDWELSKGKTFYRCQHCKISTYSQVVPAQQEAA